MGPWSTMAGTWLGSCSKGEKPTSLKHPDSTCHQVIHGLVFADNLQRNTESNGIKLECFSSYLHINRPKE
jgi:hypothetical protein